MEKGRYALMKTLTAFKCLRLLVIPVFAALLVFSCSDPESPPVTDDPGYDRANPDNLLLMLAGSYKEMDLDGYDECLCEDFRFYFTDEIADSLGLPSEDPWWGKTDDLMSTGNMFASQQVTDVRFTFEYVTEWAPFEAVRGDTTYTGLRRRLDPLIEVVIEIESSEDPLLIYRVDDSWLDITIAPDPYEAGLWFIVGIEESHRHELQNMTAGTGAATEPGTWGEIKSMWR
jgi:hypothetical protein